MKMVKYQKWCFDHIEGIMAENKILTIEVDQLRSELEKADVDRTAWEEQIADLSQQLVERNIKRSGMI